MLPSNPRQPPPLLGRVRPHPWVWRRVHWPVLSTACLPCVNLPATHPSQAVGRLKRPLEPDHNLGQVNRLCVCHQGPTVGRNPHRLGEHREEWRGWHPLARPAPRLPSAPQYHPKDGHHKRGHWPCSRCPLQGGASPGGHGGWPGWDEPGRIPSWQLPLPAPARTFRTAWVLKKWSLDGARQPLSGQCHLRGLFLVPRELVPLEPNSGHGLRSGQARCRVVWGGGHAQVKSV